jgi:hypothetical protein
MLFLGPKVQLARANGLYPPRAEIALAKAFAEQGIKDGVQVNSVSPGAVMTGRRKSFF